MIRAQRQLAARLDDLEAAIDGPAAGQAHRDLVMPSGGLPVGAPAPGFFLADLEGRQVSLDDLFVEGKPIVLLFVNTGCSPCSALLPDVEMLRQKYCERLGFAVISKGTAEENRVSIGRHINCAVLIDSDSGTSDDYRSRWTPSAVVIETGKTIASGLASGYEAVIALIHHAASEPVRPWRGAKAGESTGVEFGARAPDFSLPDLDGRKVSLSDYAGSRVLLIFWSAECGFCMEMLEELKEYERRAGTTDAKLLLITRGRTEANQTMGLGAPVLLDPEERVFKEFGAAGTPSAVLVNEDGKAVSFLETGAADVLALAGVRNTGRIKIYNMPGPLSL